MSRYERRLDKVKENAVSVPLSAEKSYVLMSDCHRGDGNWNDNFSNNKNIYLAALQEYYKKGFVYLELGDGDELWENRKMTEILEKHEEVFDLMKRFYCEKRLYMLYGNHDLQKGKKIKLPCFSEIPVYESIMLKKQSTDQGILLFHGHQGDLWNETFWYLTRFLVRYIWRPLEQIGIKDPTSAAKNYRKKVRVEKRMSEWARKRKQIIIVGHTHRPHLSKEGDQSWYFNTGSGVHPYSITAIEIVKGKMSLVKWHQVPDCNQYIRVEKEILEGPVSIERLFRDTLEEV